MVRYFLTDLRGNPIYSFAQRLRRNRLNNPPLFTPPRRFLSPAYLHDDDAIENADDLSPSYFASSSSPNRLQSTTNFVSICLVCLIRNQAWDDALKRIQSHPAEVLLMDALTGNTVLHTACRLGPPPAIVRALAVEVTARHANYEGATPLHMAASHRCSAASIQALLDVCRTLPVDDPDYGSILEDGTAAKHTSPTADLSRMGRAPIHYACMSFRGLDIQAFRLLLDETLREGNVWVWERNDAAGGDDYMENHEMHSTSLLNQGSKVMEVEEEEEDEMGDENETRDDLNDLGLCEFEYELDRDLYHQYPKSISMEDLTLDGSKKEGSRHPIRVLVNVMGIKDATGQTPLGLLFRRYRERVRCVINTVDKIRKESQVPSEPSTVDRAALVAAIRVHADLGELWEKARWIVARLTEERLLRERLEQGGGGGAEEATDHSMEEEAYPYHLTKTLAPLIPPVRRDATSRRATYYGGSAKAIPTMPLVGRRAALEDLEVEEPPSPVAQEAASWAVELHPTKGEDANSLILPFAPDISTAIPDRSVSKAKEPLDEKSFHSSGGVTGPPPRLLRPNNFRIVHASVGLTGYGCPPELIRLAISIHPNQVMEMDQDGNLPIHIAVTAASYLANADPPISQQEKEEMTAPNDDHSVISALSFFSSATVSHTSNPFDKVMKILLQHYPAGAWTPQGKTGRLPLVLAIESKGKRTWADGIRTLLQAYPPALHNRKVMEPILYPHVLSLVGAGPTGSSDRKRGRHETCSRDTLFELLRSKPEWLTRGFVEPEGE